MPLPIVRNDIKYSLCHKIDEATSGSNLHSFFAKEAERIRQQNPQVIHAIEFFSQDAELPSMRNLPEQTKEAIRRKAFRLAILVYLLLESQQEVDDIEKNEY